MKFHLRTQQGIKNLTNAEAASIVAKDRESHQRDLFEAIEKGDFPKWTLYFQIMTEEQAQNYKENPFDITKTWSHKEFPLIEVGVLELNRNPENYFQDVEQAAFAPTHLIPGIGLSPDKLLQGRLFAYGDAQRYRLGINHNQIPVNAPVCPVHAYHRDGAMRMDGNYGATKGYAPNGLGEWEQQPEYRHPAMPVDGAIDNYNPYEDKTDDCFYQPGNLYRLMTETQKQILIANTVEDIMPVTENIKYRHAAHCFLADKDYGERIAKGLALDLKKVEEIAEMTEDERLYTTRSK